MEDSIKVRCIDEFEQYNHSGDFEIKVCEGEIHNAYFNEGSEEYIIVKDGVDILAGFLDLNRELFVLEEFAIVE